MVAAVAHSKPSSADETGTVRLKWFFGTDAIASMAKKDARLLVTGEVKRYRFDKELVHPEVESLPEPEPDGSGAAGWIAYRAETGPDCSIGSSPNTRRLRACTRARCGD